MSGGFFRGTSADQDTRFSNKQAKLLKSQKFAPELENLVDITKVKMDVMRPWIAKRVTELIGFEDEVLINFIYGLLEGKAVNGKQIQISLTGFMERNTGKFMKELWALLLSAQQNMSGVPQQFLDAKEEETKNKKAETDRIANEIQRKKEREKQEIEQEKTKMDGDGAKYAGLELDVKHDGRDSSIHPADEKERHKRNGLGRRDRSSQSPDSADYSPSPRRKLSASPSRSSNSRSHSERRSRVTSRAPPSKSRSISSEGQRRSSPRRSVTPRWRPSIRRSPSPWRRSLHSRRRSTSGSRRRSPSPVRYRVRSPQRYRSRSPLLRRSRSPVRRRSRTPMRFRSRSPIRRRSPSPMRGRSPSPTRGRSPSPVRRRSPAPLRNRSPLRRRSPSPVRRRSPPPLRRRSPSPLRRRSPSPSRRQSPSPARRRYRRAPSTPRQQSISPVRRRSSMHGRKRSFTPVRRRSLSPQESSSPSQVRPSSLSPVGRASLKSASSPTKFPGERVRSLEKYTPARRASPNERTELAKDREGSTAVERRPVVSLRSPQRDMLARNNLRGKERHLSPIQKSPSVSDASLDKCYSEERRSTSPRRSPYQRRERMVRPESPSALPRTAGPKPRRHSSGTGDDAENLFTRNRSSAKISPVPVRHKDTLDTLDSAEIGGRAGSTKSRKIQLPNSERLPDRVDHKEHHEQEELSTTRKTTGLGEKGRESYVDAGDRDKEKNKARVDDSKDGHRFPELEGVPKLSRKSEQNDQNGSLVSPSKQTDEPRTKAKEKRKHKKSDRQEVESDDISSYDSYEERKESKRRRKEEKKLKKEERRRRREERRRRRDERHAEKLKSKSVDSRSSSSDLGRDHSEDESVKRRESRASNIQETETERKKLEIELREKALKSLRAKKGIDN